MSVGAVECLSQVQLQIVEERMRPGGWSILGFLGKSQSLVEVAKKDRATLQKIGATFEQFARCLAYIVSGYDRHSSRNSVPLLDGKYLVLREQSKGSQRCPFTFSDEDCGLRRGSANYTIIDADTKECFFFASLMLHLIDDHHFFQGGPYRVDPETMIAFFTNKVSGEIRGFSGTKDFSGTALEIKMLVSIDSRQVIIPESLPKQKLDEESPEADSEVLKRYSITHAQFADRLSSVVGKAATLQSMTIFNETFFPLIEGKYLVQQHDLREKKGRCPKCYQNFSFANYTVVSIETSQCFTFSSFVSHLIKQHQIFPKRGEFSIESERVIQFFGLKKEIDYLPKVKTEGYWEDNCYYSCSVEEEDLAFVKKIGSQYFALHPEVHAYLFHKSTASQAELIGEGSRLSELEPGAYLYVANCREGMEESIFDCKQQPIKIGEYLFREYFPPGSGLFKPKEKQEAVLESTDRLVQAERAVFIHPGEPIFLDRSS